ncbi:MAG: DUF4112 domain-containing protein [Verrucomicrobiota bacterium]
MRLMSRLLDNWIQLPGGFRIGLDPIIGLMPGLGDFLGSIFSLWIVYDAARLGIRPWHLVRMILNVVIESVIGAIPLAGDIFDAVWKANAKNMLLVERHYHLEMKGRGLGQIIAAFGLLIAVFYGTMFLVFYLLFRMIAGLIS